MNLKIALKRICFCLLMLPYPAIFVLVVLSLAVICVTVYPFRYVTGQDMKKEIFLLEKIDELTTNLHDLMEDLKK